MSNVPTTSDILAISLDGKGSPSIYLNLPKNSGGDHAHGWGFGWYPDDHLSAMLTKDPAALGEQVMIDSITDWSSFRSTTFFFKIHGACKGYSHAQTQPFSRSFAGRDWLFLHNGDLNKSALEDLHGRKSRLLEPLGNTDSELAFCNLLTQLQEGDGRRIADVEPETVHKWFKRFDSLGCADMFWSDGETTVCFHGSQSPKPMYYKRVQPPDNQEVYKSEAAEIVLNDARDTYRTALIVSSSPFSQGEWTQVQPAQMIMIRRGAIIWQSVPESPISAKPPAQPQPQQKTTFMTETQAEQAQCLATQSNASATILPKVNTNYRLYDVTHITHYEYAKPVEHSTHTFRLQPINDATQEVVSSRLTISSPAEEIRYDDVFGNMAAHYIISQPYTKLSVEAVSRVKVYKAPPDNHSLSRRQTSIPLAWMPWQRQMMMPYLLPPELPESQLTELTDYAMSFVERNDYHLMHIIEDLNQRIYRDYKYVSGSTSLITTPFQVYTSRQGVCQDFANLFICLARLLSIPSRYRMGYIFTGTDYDNKIQSDASHAWVEVYLPYVGWRGFDPTNGCAVNQDHVRVACGRNYRDATPTSGTIYKGGGTETLKIDVKVQEVFNES